MRNTHGVCSALRLGSCPSYPVAHQTDVRCCYESTPTRPGECLVRTGPGSVASEMVLPQNVSRSHKTQGQTRGKDAPTVLATTTCRRMSQPPADLPKSPPNGPELAHARGECDGSGTGGAGGIGGLAGHGSTKGSSALSLAIVRGDTTRIPRPQTRTQTCFGQKGDDGAALRCERQFSRSTYAPLETNSGAHYRRAVTPRAPTMCRCGLPTQRCAVLRASLRRVSSHAIASRNLT